MATSKKDRSAINWFEQYEREDASVPRPRRVSAPASSRRSIGKLERTPRKPVWTYVPGGGAQVSVKEMDSRFQADDGSIDVAAWAKLRRNVDRFVTGHSAGRPAKSGPKITVGGKTYTDIGEAYKAADRISRNNERRGKVAAALKRLGIGFNGFSDTGEISDAEKKDIQKKLGKYRMSDMKEQYGRLLDNSRDYNDQYMTWEKKKIADATQAAKGRADVRSAEGKPVGVSGASAEMDRPGGHAAPQSFWDGRPNMTRASRGKVGDPQHYYTRDDSWRYNVNNTRGGLAAIRDRVDKSSWMWSADGRRARVHNRLVDAMNKYNDLQKSALADQIEALTELSSLGIAPEPAPVRNSLPGQEDDLTDDYIS